jgi:hypothetical protein
MDASTWAGAECWRRRMLKMRMRTARRWPPGCSMQHCRENGGGRTSLREGREEQEEKG